MCPDSILSHLAFQEYHLIFIEIPHFGCALYVTLKGLEIEKYENLKLSHTIG